MRPIKLLMIFALVLLLPALGSAQKAAGTKANIATTAHNIGTNACQSCHQPHVPQHTKVMWRLNLPTATYNLHQGGTQAINNTVGGTDATDNFNSATCLGCHDAATAPSNDSLLDALYGPGTYITVTGNHIIADSTSANGDLTNDHPVMMSLTGLTGYKTPGVSDPAIVYNNTVQCGSCHDPHISTPANFLRDSTSTLCLSCHT